MNTNKKTATPAVADKVFTFLRVFATVPEVTKILATAAGFKKKDYDEGWTLLSKVAHFEGDPTTGTPDISGALRELDDWIDVAFRRVRAALHRLHPEQEAFVFKNLEATRGAQAVVGVQVFLDRLDALESSSERAATQTEDHAALETLAGRDLDKTERARLRQLVNIAMSAPDLEAILSRSEPAQDDVDKLAAWYDDWSETARATIVDRKDILFRLGVAKRRKNRPAVEASPEPTPAPAPPVAAPVVIPPVASPVQPVVVAPVITPSPVTNGSSAPANPIPFA